MFNTKEVFDEIHTPTKQAYAILGDGTNKLPIQGFGLATIYVNNKPVRFHRSAYNPELEMNLYSVMDHAEVPGQSFSLVARKHLCCWNNTYVHANKDAELTVTVSICPGPTSRPPHPGPTY
eukprot:3703049-Ditylum_brightwellii.AAC.1